MSLEPVYESAGFEPIYQLGERLENPFKIRELESKLFELEHFPLVSYHRVHDHLSIFFLLVLLLPSKVQHVQLPLRRRLMIQVLVSFQFILQVNRTGAIQRFTVKFSGQLDLALH